MKGIYRFVLVIALELVVAILVIVAITLASGIDLNGSIDASTVNGLLTATAVVFAFVSSEARKIESFIAKICLLIPLIMFLMYTGAWYYVAVMETGHATKFVLLLTMTNFYFSILSFIAVVLHPLILGD